MTNGVLIVVGKKKILQVKFTNANGKDVSIAIADSELSPELTELKRTAVNKLEGLAVELEETKGQPFQVREQGKVWYPSKSFSTASATTQQPQRGPLQPSGDFHNPYNFVPAPPRKISDLNLGDSDIDKRPLPGHGFYHLDRWSGRISVKLKTITPLLIPDAAKLQEDNGHKTYPIRVDVEGKPYLPATSIKGMLRSAYEAVTNSRFSVFKKHGDRLAYRMPTKQGLQMVPAIIDNASDKSVIQLYCGTSSICHDGTPDGALYAAWLPRYSGSPVKYLNGESPQHGDQVKAWVEKIQHHRWDRYRNGGCHLPDFQYWRVRQIVPETEQLRARPAYSQDPGPKTGRSYHQSLNIIEDIEGFVCITNKNIDRKHDERVFFADSSPIEADLTKDLREQWHALIQNYQKTHEDELKKGRSGPPALNDSVWSRHITGKKEEYDLSQKTLCFAHVEKQNSKLIVKGLYPVTIPRALFNVSPEDLLAWGNDLDSKLVFNLQPAKALTELSPADRVFGWVSQNGKGAYKGHLRVSKVQCHPDSDDQDKGITHFEQGLPLAILGQPKPEQARFYVAKNKQGEPLDNGSAKEEGYQNNNGLRGRKVYLHHKLPAGYWKEPMEDRTQVPIEEKYFQEYRRPRQAQNNRVIRHNKTNDLNLQKEQKDDQNRSIKAWIRPEVEFTFNIDISNLSDVELGALLWLLSLPDNHYHRLGGGKPLGFGSVQITIDWGQTDLRKGEGWKKFYGSIDEVFHQIDDAAIKKTIEIFKKAVVEAYGKENDIAHFQQIPFIQAFCRCAEGFNDGKPIHYPRTLQPGQNGPVPPHPEGKAFEWFTMNEKGQKLSLPKLIADHGLPYSP